MPFTHEPESAFRKGQIGIESIYGTGVDASVALGSVTLTPSPMKTTNLFTPRGVLLPTVQTTGEESTEVSFDGIATFSDIGYFIKDIVSDAQVDPITASMVYTVEAGGLKIPGCVVTDWTLKGNKNEVTLSGKMIGKKGEVAAPTAALTPAAQVPLLAAGAVITINSVVQAKVFEWELAVSGMWGGATYVGSAEFVNILQKAFQGTFKIKQAFDSQSQAVMAIGSEVACSVVVTAGGRSVTIAFQACVGQPDTLSDEDGIYAITNNLNIMSKSTTAIDVTIDNTP